MNHRGEQNSILGRPRWDLLTAFPTETEWEGPLHLPQLPSEILPGRPRDGRQALREGRDEPKRGLARGRELAVVLRRGRSADARVGSGEDRPFRQRITRPLESTS